MPNRSVLLFSDPIFGCFQEINTCKVSCDHWVLWITNLSWGSHTGGNIFYQSGVCVCVLCVCVCEEAEAMVKVVLHSHLFWIQVIA